ncbi:efflux RND transporter permease subunit [Microbacterium horticulturae]|uniref:Efflux RND transporter permease subunit n=1 Tax=Microbacterium horticulturae TaxID=3028316 RepID=A0ABY8BZK4_9MICO|nr:efflux RND transporter permease subunit [Microbacterium sp. KACC 23027]WEG09639.1 efflux RND transporter permease subunit [Microbacterium sp. KACC 23027]
MSTLLAALGRWSFRHPWRVLVAWLLLLGLAGGGVALFAQGTDNSFSIPGTESQEGLEQLSRTFPQVSGTSAQAIVVAADGEKVDAAPYTSDVKSTVNRLEDLDGMLAVSNPFSGQVDGLVSDNDTAAIIQMQFDGQVTDISDSTKAALEEVIDDLRAELPDGATVHLGGDLYSTELPTISITEAVGLVIALLVLIVTFRSFLVAGMPLLTALLGVGLSMALIYVSTAFSSISSTTPLLALMLGLAVGIDYALFIISRHQDQVRGGMDPEESAARATGTAGSAVVFAGVTVLIALIGLSFANIPFLTTMGIAAAVAVAIAVAVAVTLTPAFLGFAKGRVVGWKMGAPKKKNAKAKKGFAARWVGLVTRHPVVTTVAVVASLGALSVPAASLALALPNAGMLPQDSQARQTYDLVSEHFGPGFNGPLIMTGTIVQSNDPLNLMHDIGDDIAKLPGVESVALATPNETADTGIVQIIPTTAPDDPATADLVRELRDQHDRILDEYGVDMKVTGFTAVAIDISDRLGGALLPFGVFVVGLSLVLLAIVFRSIWVPLKAAAGYLLSVGAAFGIVSLVFVHGVGADLLNVTKVGPIISFMPIVLMGVLFGLAMDYEVFLVSRMREDYVHGLRRAEGRTPRRVAQDAVRSGYSASARVVTAAAVIMFAVFAAFVPEGDMNLKPIALGLASGVAIDAFLVRMTLVPAVMALLGDKAWWMPKWLGMRLPHFDIEGEAVEREISLADWPEPHTRAAVVAEGLELESADGTELYRDASLRIEPGGTLVLHGRDHRAARALALTIAGRVAPTDGRIKVNGHLLPGRAAWVRGHVGVALLTGAADPAAEIRRALKRRTRLLVVDGLDAAASAGTRDQVTAQLRDAASLAPDLTIVATAASPAAVSALLSEAGRTADVVDVAAAPHRATAVPTATSELPEVIA